MSSIIGSITRGSRHAEYLMTFRCTVSLSHKQIQHLKSHVQSSQNNGFVYSADADGRRGLCVFGKLCVDMWRLVHQWSFLLFDCFWLLLTIGTLLVHLLGTVLIDLWRLVHQCYFCCFDCLLTVFDYFWRLVHCWYTVGTVLVDMWWLVQ